MYTYRGHDIERIMDKWEVTKDKGETLYYGTSLEDAQAWIDAKLKAERNRP